MRPSMQLRALSTPAAIWLWSLPEVMLSMKPLSFSESACARLSLKAPLAAKEPVGCWVSLPDHVHGLSPRMRSGPEYGISAIPFDPKMRSETSNHLPGQNCVDEKLTWTSSG